MPPRRPPNLSGPRRLVQPVSPIQVPIEPSIGKGRKGQARRGLDEHPFGRKPEHSHRFTVVRPQFRDADCRLDANSVEQPVVHFQFDTDRAAGRRTSRSFYCFGSTVHSASKNTCRVQSLLQGLGGERASIHRFSSGTAARRLRNEWRLRFRRPDFVLIRRKHDFHVSPS